MSTNSLFKPRYQFFGSRERMDEEARKKAIAENVARYRKAAGLSQAALTKLIGVKSQNTIAQIEIGKTGYSKHLYRISQALKVSMADLDPSVDVEEAVRVPDLLWEGGKRDLKVFDSVEAGEGAIVFHNEPAEMIERPPPLIGVRGGYGVLVKGTSMLPMVRPGHIAMVNPHLVPRVEDLCLFMSEEDGTFRATLKEYCGQTGKAWKVKRYFPKENTFHLDKKEWPRCEVVVMLWTRR